MNSDEWTWDDFLNVTNIRKFNSNRCSCSEWMRYSSCKHCYVCDIIRGAKIPLRNEIVDVKEEYTPLEIGVMINKGISSQIHTRIDFNYWVICITDGKSIYNMVHHTCGRKDCRQM